MAAAGAFFGAVLYSERYGCFNERPWDSWHCGPSRLNIWYPNYTPNDGSCDMTWPLFQRPTGSFSAFASSRNPHRPGYLQQFRTRLAKRRLTVQGTCRTHVIATRCLSPKAGAAYHFSATNGLILGFWQLKMSTIFFPGGGSQTDPSESFEWPVLSIAMINALIPERWLSPAWSKMRRRRLRQIQFTTRHVRDLRLTGRSASRWRPCRWVWTAIFAFLIEGG